MNLEHKTGKQPVLMLERPTQRRPGLPSWKHYAQHRAAPEESRPNQALARASEHGATTNPVTSEQLRQLQTMKALGLEDEHDRAMREMQLKQLEDLKPAGPAIHYGNATPQQLERLEAIQLPGRHQSQEPESTRSGARGPPLDFHDAQQHEWHHDGDHEHEADPSSRNS